MQGIRTHRNTDSNSNGRTDVDDQPASFAVSACYIHAYVYPHRNLDPLPNFNTNLYTHSHLDSHT